MVVMLLNAQFLNPGCGSTKEQAAGPGTDFQVPWNVRIYINSPYKGYYNYNSFNTSYSTAVGPTIYWRDFEF